MIAVVTALREEVKDFLAWGEFKVAHQEWPLRLYESLSLTDVVVIEGGIGKECVETATQEAIRRYEPDYIVSAGFAGAVQPGLKPGDLFLCDRLWSVGGDPLFWKPEAAVSRALLDAPLKERVDGDMAGSFPDYTYGGCLSVGLFIGSRSLKDWIGGNFPVSIIDMESYWVSEIAAQKAIPHLVLRSVLDTMEQTLPQFIGQAAGNERDRTWKRGLRYMLSRPGEAPALLQMARQAKVARAALAGFLKSVTSNGRWTPAFQVGRG